MTMTIIRNVVVFLILLTSGEALAQTQLQFKTAIAGPYIVFSNRYYVTGSLSAQIGTYGHKTNTSQGFVVTGGFTPPTPVTATIASFSENTIKSMQGTFNVNAPPFINVSFSGQNTSGTVASMIATVWQMPQQQVGSYFKQLVASLLNGPDLAQDDFRYMIGNIMVSQYQTTSNINFNTQLTTTIDVAAKGGNPSGTISANIGASGNNQQTMSLSQNTIIGYQWNMVCWKNGAPINFWTDSFSLIPTPTSLRPANCPGFKQSQSH
jgi:hypothetical protein